MVEKSICSGASGSLRAGMAEYGFEQGLHVVLEVVRLHAEYPSRRKRKQQEIELLADAPEP